MPDPVLVLSRGQRLPRSGLPAGSELVDSLERVRERARSRRATWFAPRSADLELLVASGALLGLTGDHRLVVLDRVDRSRSDVLRAVFRYVLSTADHVRLLPPDHLLEAMASPARDDLIVGVATDQEARLVVLIRGSLQPLVVPMSFFGVEEGRHDATSARFAPADFGHAIAVGDREASTDGVLYAFDADYRRRRKALLVEQDESFGGAVRRLRRLRGVARTDFPGLSSKEVARIERGEVSRPHRVTVEILAARLGVRPEEIASY